MNQPGPFATRCLSVDPAFPAHDVLQQAAELLLAGELVAFPTETVYGLGANALNPDAVARIFAVKGRPATNPVIVHVPDLAAAQGLSSAWPKNATELASRFWPGPLTLVVPCATYIPRQVTAGGETVALRVPAHPVALALLRTCGQPLAAPSANRSEQISPSTAQHVLASLGGRIPLVLDGGPCQVGLESTVVDLCTPVPKILRPGMLSWQALQAVLPNLAPPESVSHEPTVGPARAPGQHLRHYAPRMPAELVQPGAELLRLEAWLNGPHPPVRPVAWLTLDTTPKEARRKFWAMQTAYFATLGGSPLESALESALVVSLPNEPAAYAAALYAALHQLEAVDPERILITPPPQTNAWLAIHDRLSRATGALEIRR